MAWSLSIENIPCWKQILLFWESLAGTKSSNLGPSVANIKPKSITPTPNHGFFILDFLPFINPFSPWLNVKMCPPSPKKVVTNQIFYFLLSLRGITQNPQTQPKHSAPFPCTHNVIYCFLLIFHRLLLTWQLLCHFEWFGHQLHNCHQHGLSSWFLKILPVKKRLLLVRLVYFTFIFQLSFFQH